MLEELLQTDNLCIMILKRLPILDIKKLMAICKIFNTLIHSSEIWKYNLMKLDYENKIAKNNYSKNNDIKIYDLIDIEVPCNFYSEFMKLYNMYGYIPKNINFRLLIDGFPYTINKRLILTKVEKYYVLQSIRDIDWEYKIDHNKLKINKDGKYFIDLLFSLMMNNNLLMKFRVKLIVNDNENNKLGYYKNFDKFPEPLPIIFKLSNIPEGFIFDITLYKQYSNSYQSDYKFLVKDDCDIYIIQFPQLTINLSIMHDLIFNMKMRNKIIQLKYII